MDHSMHAHNMVSTATPSASMDMGGSACKISMLWNWYTVGSCFISKQWHVTSMVGFAGSVLAVFVLVVIIELVRRLIREYDRKIARQAASLSGALELPPSPFRPSNSTAELLPSPATASARYVRPTLAQQALRSTLYMIQFSATYILMLLAMSYNGYILIFGIFAGAWAGHFMTSWDTVAVAEPTSKDTCC